METTHKVSAGFARATLVAYGTSRHGTLAVQRSDRADARNTPYARKARWISPQAMHTVACLSSSEDRSDCGLARVAQEPRLSQ
jgi:hypothetical protein